MKFLWSNLLAEGLSTDDANGANDQHIMDNSWLRRLYIGQMNQKIGTFHLMQLQYMQPKVEMFTVERLH